MWGLGDLVDVGFRVWVLDSRVVLRNIRFWGMTVKTWD